MSKEIIIINSLAHDAKKAKRIFSKNTYVETKNQNDILPLIKKYVNKGFEHFIVCGGDGTINNFINNLMFLNKKERKNIKIGIIPCGKANDLARELKIPLSIKNAYRLTKQSNYKNIDLIQVNSKYYITGGGFGLASEVIQDINKPKNKLLKQVFKDLAYYFIVLKKIFIKYEGIKIKKKKEKMMFLVVNNQSFIGKRFKLTPSSLNNDNFFEICYIKKPNNSLTAFSIINKITKRKHTTHKMCTIKKSKILELELEKDSWFMADGELLEYNKKFLFKIKPKEVKILC